MLGIRNNTNEQTNIIQITIPADTALRWNDSNDQLLSQVPAQIYMVMQLSFLICLMHMSRHSRPLHDN